MEYIEGISFELTRRCNLKCSWCSKGDAQDLDMSKEIIDKALDEVSGFYLYTIRITGGEPSLVPELIEYLIDGIIERHIIVNCVHMITNATIKSQKIKDCIQKYLSYAESIQEERNKIEEFFGKMHDVFFPSIKGKDLAWLIQLSTWEHDNLETYEDVKRFYGDIHHKNYQVITQDELGDREHRGQIVIEGNAEKNYHVFSEEDLEQVRTVYNKYCIIKDGVANKDTKKCITKILSVGANGKVYVGCIMSYEHVEENYLFNIMDCNHDFWRRVDEWCWKHPISATANNFMQMYYGLKWQYEHGIGNVSEELMTAFDKLEGQIQNYRKILMEYHPQLPYLTHSEMNLFAVVAYCLAAYENGVTQDLLKPFIEYAIGFDDETIALMDKAKCESVANRLIKQNNDIKVSKIENPFERLMATIYKKVDEYTNA